MEKKIKIRQIVKGHYVKDNEDRRDRQLNLSLSEYQAEQLENLLVENGFEWHGSDSPVKFDKDTDEPYLKTHTQFDVEARNIPSGYKIDDLGEGSEVTVYLKIKDGQYRRKKYVSAYLLAVEVHNFVEKELYSAFDDSGFTDTPYVTNAPSETPFNG